MVNRVRLTTAASLVAVVAVAVAAVAAVSPLNIRVLVLAVCEVALL